MLYLLMFSVNSILFKITAHWFFFFFHFVELYASFLFLKADFVCLKHHLVPFFHYSFSAEFIVSAVSQYIYSLVAFSDMLFFAIYPIPLTLNTHTIPVLFLILFPVLFASFLFYYFIYCPFMILRSSKQSVSFKFRFFRSLYLVQTSHS